MRILGKKKIKIKRSKSKLGFAKTGGGSWKVWDRFITYDGQKLFHIGNVCGTCNFFFTRQENSLSKSIVSGNLVDRLNDGLIYVDLDIVKDYSLLFPNDTYEVLLLEIYPRLIFPNDTDDYFIKDLLQTWEGDDENEDESWTNTEYYRGQDKKILEEDKIYEFFIPIYPTSQLNEERVRFYEQKIIQGNKPTALAVSVLDVKCPLFYPEVEGIEVKPEFFTHWCLANYLLDGHHKIFAAHRQKKSITLLTYLSRGESWKLVDKLITYSKE